MNVFKKRINDYADALMSELHWLSKRVEDVENQEVLKFIADKMKEVYDSVEDLVFYAYRNKKEDK